MVRSVFPFALGATAFLASMSGVEAFTLPASFGIAAANTATATPLFMADADFVQNTPEGTKDRIQGLVDDNPVVLFMKGSELFPQCGFSNTAVQIMQTFGIPFKCVDVLADEAIRTGVKDFSQWPTIPQLYVTGEFIGGSDIMIEMYQNGELGEMIEKAKADML